jgi:ankyrin repeat protein
MGCCKSQHQFISPDASQPSDVIHIPSTNKLSAAVSPLPPNHSSSSATHHPTISSASHPLTDETGLVYLEKQSNAQNLVALCKKGKLETIQTLFTNNPRGADLNMKGMWGNTPLIVACQYHHPEVALYLLQYSSIDIIHMNDHGATALLYACLEGLDLVVQKLLAMGCNPNTKPAVVYNSQTDRSDQMTPLIAAIVNGHLEILKSLISVECDLHIKISQKSDQVAIVDGKKLKLEIHEMTPLMIASRYQQKEIFHYLLTEGGPFNCLLQDSEGFSVLHYLCRAKKPNNTVVPAGAAASASDEPASSSPSPPSPLPIAVKMLTLFLESIPDSSSLLELLSLSDKKGSLPIHIASESTFLELVECLLKTEQNLLELLTVDRNLFSYSSSASASSPHHPIHTQQVRAMNGMGYTALHISIKKRCTEVVKLLLDYGSDPYQPLVASPQRLSQTNSSSNSEKCAYDAAMKLRQNTEIYQLLASHHKSRRDKLQQEQKEEQDEGQASSLISSAATAAAAVVPVSRTTVQILQSQDTKEGDDAEAEGEESPEEEYTGQELRIHELVSSLSSSNATPKLTGERGKVKDKDRDKERDGETHSSTLSTAIVTTATSLVEHLLLDSSFLTPVKTKPSVSSSAVSSSVSSLERAPVKATSAERSNVSLSQSLREMEKDGEVVRFPSPLRFPDEHRHHQREEQELTLLSP